MEDYGLGLLFFPKGWWELWKTRRPPGCPQNDSLWEQASQVGTLCTYTLAFWWGS